MKKPSRDKKNQPAANLQTLLAQAINCHKRGDLQGAESAYRAILSKQPDQFDALHLLGVLKILQAGKTEEAVALITRALKIKPDYADAHYNLGCALQSLNRVGEAINGYTNSL